MRTVLFLFLFGCLTSASAATYYVDASRPDDSGDGASWAAAKQTIQAAVDLSGSGDTVLVTNGVYDVGSRVAPGGALSNRVVITKAITVRSVNGATMTVIEGSGTNYYGSTSSIRCVFMSDGKLEGFTLRKGATRSSGATADKSGGAVYAMDAAPGTEVRFCVMSNNAAYSGGATYHGALTSCTLARNTVTDSGGGACNSSPTNCTFSGNAATYGGGLYGGMPTACTLTNNTATYGGGSYEGRLVNCVLSKNTATTGGGSYGSVLANCTVTRNTATSTGGGSTSGALTNCIVYYNSAPVSNNHYRSALAYTCSTPLSPGTGNISYDPSFFGDGEVDYRLASGSPCLNTGANAVVSVDTDFAGNARIQDGIIDMGAYEGPTSSSLDAPSVLSASDGLFFDRVRITWSAVAGATHYRVYRASSLDGIKEPISGWQTVTVFDDTSVTPHVTYWYWVRAASDAQGCSYGPLSLADSGFPKTFFYVNAARSDDSGNGLSWPTAKKTIQAAVNLTLDGDTVLVTNGTYNTGMTVTPGGTLNNRVVITNAITVRSVNGATVTDIWGSGTNFYGTSSAIRSVYMTAGTLDGFCLRSGTTRSSGAAADCSGGGAFIFGAGGTLCNCTLLENSALEGGGSYGGSSSNCTFLKNAASYGGGTYGGRLLNCALSRNSATYGGGSYEGSLVNCTLTKNTAASYGGGTTYGALTNCIAYFNTSALSNNCFRSTLAFTCSWPLPSGEGNMANDPLFTDDSHLSCTSPCIGAGSYAYCSGTDIDGQLWLSPPSMGCDQFYPTLALTVVSAFGGAVPAGLSSNLYGTVIDARVTNSPISGVSTQAVCVGASVVGNAYDQVSPTQVSLTLTNHATLTWNWQASYLLGTGATGSGTVSGVGWYEAGSNATLTATPADGSIFVSWGGDTNGCLTDGTTLIAPMTQARSVTARFILNVQAATPIFTPASGTVFSNTLSVTISCATAGAEIRYTTDGSDPSASSPLYNEPLTLQWDTTVKAQAFKADRLPSAIATATYDARLICYVSAARPNDSGDGRSWASAKRTIQAAVDLARTGDEVLVTNGFYAEGGAVQNSVSNRVAITNAITVRSVNGPSVTFIVGAPDPRTGNSGTNAVRCARLTAGLLAGFTLTNGYTRADGDQNWVQGGGGAMLSGGSLSNCVVAGCTAAGFGGGLNLRSGSHAWNCIIAGNSAKVWAGGIKLEDGSRAYNCLIRGNSATNCGGGAYIYQKGSLINCTVISNRTQNGGGVYVFQNPDSTLTNCIVYYNSATVASNNCFAAGLAFSCTTPLAPGEGNLTNAPLLKDSMHLGTNSPCLGAGIFTVCRGTDIDGQPWLSPPCMGCDQVSRFTLSILSACGGANPAGVITNYSGALIHAWVTNSPLQVGATQWVCVGASATGTAFEQVTSTHVSLSLTNNAALTWNWEGSYQPFTYLVTASNAVTITGYLGPAGWVTIPSLIGDKAVTSIGTNAFAGCTGVTGVTLPSSVTNIGAYAFAGCFGLTGVTIPSSVTGIGFAAFVDCISLQGITVQSGNPNYCSVGGVLFNKALTTLIQCPGGKSGSYAIPASVTAIGNSAFQNCGGLTSVTLPSGITTIGVSAFLYCSSLTSLKFGTQVALIGNSAFAGCAQLAALYFLGNAPNLGLNVFTGVSMGIVYYVPGTTGWSASYGGLPTATWDTVISNVWVQENALCFDITGPDNQSVIVKATTNLIGGTWTSLSTHTLTNGVSHFCDTHWAEHPKRFYRVSVVPEPETLVLVLIGAAAIGLRRKKRPPSQEP